MYIYIYIYISGLTPGSADLPASPPSLCRWASLDCIYTYIHIHSHVAYV